MTKKGRTAKGESKLPILPIPEGFRDMIEEMALPLLERDGGNMDEIAQMIADRLGPAIDAALGDILDQRLNKPPPSSPEESSFVAPRGQTECFNPEFTRSRLPRRTG